MKLKAIHYIIGLGIIYIIFSKGFADIVELQSKTIIPKETGGFAWVIIIIIAIILITLLKKGKS